MHSTPPRRPTHRSARLRRALAIAAPALLAVACSTMPDPRWPPRLVGEIEVVHDRGGAIEVPASDAELTILELVADPPALAERFEGARRIWVLPEGGAALRCRYRVFGDPETTPDPFATAPRVDERFPGARVLSHRATSSPPPGREAARR